MFYLPRSIKTASFTIRKRTVNVSKTGHLRQYTVYIRPFFYFNTSVVFIVETNLKLKDKNYLNKLIFTVPFIVENNLKIKDEEYLRIAGC
jgi:hypothetical protein